jgi:septum formation protein
MIFERLKEFKILLASQSPRRQQLLKDLGIDFEIKVIDGIEEGYPENLKSHEIALYLAEHKARHYTDYIDDKTILITADTIVWLNNEVLEKPVDFNDAVNILKKLSGNKHSVITGICLMTKSKSKSFYVETEVSFKNLSEEEIKYYIENYKPYDKAGAYGIQEWIGYVGIEKISGSYYNVVGLPVQKLYTELNNFI